LLYVVIAAWDAMNDRPTQFSSTEVESGNYKNGISALSCAPPRVGCCYAAADLYSVRKCESTSMHYGNVLATVSPLRSACLAMHHTTII